MKVDDPPADTSTPVANSASANSKVAEVASNPPVVTKVQATPDFEIIETNSGASASVPSPSKKLKPGSSKTPESSSHDYGMRPKKGRGGRKSQPPSHRGGKK